jgi:hypothetical protein
MLFARLQGRLPPRALAFVLRRVGTRGPQLYRTGAELEAGVGAVRHAPLPAFDGKPRQFDPTFGPRGAHTMTPAQKHEAAENLCVLQLFKEGVLRFQHTIPVKLTADAHLIVAVSGDNDSIKTCYGSSDQSKLKPFAYHNPIFVDIDGKGFTPNGDDLGFPVTGKRVTLDAAKAFLEARKQNP